MAVHTTTRPQTAWVDEPEPAWDIARLFPAQGHWTAADYLVLDTNLRVEFSHGSVEVQDRPTQRHQLLVAYLFRHLADFVAAHGLGVVLFAGIRVRLWPGKCREPDVAFMLAGHDGRRGEQYWEGADLVMEVVSDDRDRDFLTKRREYARAGIPEYWIVDPHEAQVIVLRLADGAYAVHGVFGPGESAGSALLPEFAVAVSDLFAAATQAG